MPLERTVLGGGARYEIPQPIPAPLIARAVAMRGARRSLGLTGVAVGRPPRPRFGQSHCADEGDAADDGADNAGCDLAFEQAYHAQHEIDGEDEDRRPPCRCADMARQEGGAADERSGYRQNAEDRVDRFSSLRGPVDILQVEPQRELVECEADAHPEEGGGDVESCTVRRCGHQDDSCANDDQYPENLMVNMNSSEPDVAQPGPGAAPRTNQAGHGSRDQESRQYCDKHPHYRLQRRSSRADRDLGPRGERSEGGVSVESHNVLPVCGRLLESTRRSIQTSSATGPGTRPQSGAQKRATCGARLAWQARSVKVVFNAELWLWDARRTETWTFVSLPASESEEIRDLAGGLRRGFGSVRVRATIGNSTWTTSIFPASQAGYVLPVKRPIRVAEALDVGDMATVTVELIDFT